MPHGPIPVVAIPARDEEERLPEVIAALGRQTWLRRVDRPLAVTVVLNNCVDGSAQAAALAARSQPELAVNLIEIAFSSACDHVGSARRLAMETALEAVDDCARAVVLTTDADAIPAPDWIEANLRAIDAGADLVGGLIIGDAAEEAALGAGFLRRAGLQARYAELADRLASLIDPIPHDPWPRHRDHTGGSLAVLGPVYRAVGGLPALPFREDLGFVSRVRAGGYKLRHDPAVQVGVSARLVGRAPGGMAETLGRWLKADAQGSPMLVEAPEAVESRAVRRAKLRSLALTEPEARLAAARALGIDARQLEDRAGLPRNGVSIVEALAPDEPDACGSTPVEDAILRLERMIASRERRHAA